MEYREYSFPKIFFKFLKNSTLYLQGKGYTYRATNIDIRDSKYLLMEEIVNFGFEMEFDIKNVSKTDPEVSNFYFWIKFKSQMANMDVDVDHQKQNNDFQEHKEPIIDKIK